MIKITLCIVLYQRDLDSSVTLCSIRNWRPEYNKYIEKIVLWDNSLDKISSKKIANYEKTVGIYIEYRHNGENTALSKLYNRTISKISKDSYLVILDHDTNITDQYIQDLVLAITENPKINLFLPQIMFNNELVSPAKIFLSVGKRIKTVNSGVSPSRNMMAINSGMAIKADFLKDTFPGYSEDINFYGTDNDFMDKFAQENRILYILPTQINHTLNYYDNTSINNILWRFEDMLNGAMVIAQRHNFFYKVFNYLYWGVYAGKQSIKHRNTKFVSIFISYTKVKK